MHSISKLGCGREGRYLHKVAEGAARSETEGDWRGLTARDFGLEREVDADLRRPTEIGPAREDPNGALQRDPAPALEISR